ncbi:hypothetical protein CBM2598_U30147 [Cupriavidus taiwanensis]|uniref:Uncharacterized protein n=1 Tax=Cupriavidus taiwanensis TaxID=164546 RepID=A0A7Z7JJ20_9BURK|nr:hypothetical protein CBM2598_U30147 [Cupriavidus taiwanensis]SPC25842.1 hypothetical protein CBM2594_U20029 [Cupriavidus taiwanensis]
MSPANRRSTRQASRRSSWHAAGLFGKGAKKDLGSFMDILWMGGDIPSLPGRVSRKGWSGDAGR